MKKTLRYAGVVIIMLAVFATCELLAILHSAPRDEFEFLDRSGFVRSDIESGPNLSTGLSPAMEYRIYTWAADFQEVYAAAKEELAKEGFDLVSESGLNTPNFGTVIWRNKSGRQVLAANERTYRPGESPGVEFKPNRGWVTVRSTNPAPNNWSTPMRLAYAKFKADSN